MTDVVKSLTTGAHGDDANHESWAGRHSDLHDINVDPNGLSNSLAR